MTTEAERAERIRRLQERRAAAGNSSSRRPPVSEPSDVSATQICRCQADPSEPTPAPRRPARRRHAAEASRIAVTGAGLSLTLSLMAFMARADARIEQAPGPESNPIGAVALASVAGAGDSAPAALAPATPASSIPVVLTPIQVRTRVVTAQPARPAPSSGGSVAPTRNSTAPAPPPPTTKSHGSR